jgi:hypothetical protein
MHIHIYIYIKTNYNSLQNLKSYYRKYKNLLHDHLKIFLII